MVPFAGYEMPVQYTSIIEEHRDRARRVGLFDLSHMGEIEVRGEEAVAFLRYAARQRPRRARGRAGAVLDGCATTDGGIIDDLIVYRLEDGGFWSSATPSNRDAVVEQLTGLLERGDFGAEIEDRSDRIGLVAPQGPERGGRCWPS